jgi:hypothetical protein
VRSFFLSEGTSSLPKTMTIQAIHTHRTSSLPHAYILPVVRELPSLPNPALTTQTW